MGRKLGKSKKPVKAKEGFEFRSCIANEWRDESVVEKKKKTCLDLVL